MCLSPIKIKNRSKYFNLHTFQKLSIDVPCGKCAECIAAKQNEYYFRTYYQCLDCWKQGGYVLFDTLTYDSEHLPHISDFIEDFNIEEIRADLDFPCFNYEDIRYFIVRLRRALEYDGYDVKNKLKYFVCSEYGTDPRYTHRPHYHILFFVLDKSLDPIHLSRVVNECWQKGITDGVDYNGEGYVTSKRVFWPSDELHARCVSNYVGKYLTKDTSFQDEIDRRLEVLSRYVKFVQFSDVLKAVPREEFVDLFYSYLNFEDLEGKYNALEKIKLIEGNKQWLKELKRHVNQFHRQSQGYGLYGVKYLGKDWIYEHNCIRMPDADSVWKEIPVPGYFMNKLFKSKAVDSKTGDEYMAWTDEGLEFKYYHSEENRQSAIRKYRDFFRLDNLVQYFEPYECSLIQDKVLRCLDGRTWKDFADYMLFWRGRIYKFGLDETVDSFDIESYMYIDQHQADDEVFWKDEEFDWHYYIINQDIEKFHYFDDLFNLFKKLNKYVGSKKQAAFDETVRLQKLFKSLGIKYKNK